MENNFNNYIDLNWIPRYLVIDQKTKIAKYYAITPDDPEIQITINKLLKNNLKNKVFAQHILVK